MGGLNVPSSTKVKYLAVDNLILAHAVNADESPFFCAWSGVCDRRRVVAWDYGFPIR